MGHGRQWFAAIVAVLVLLALVGITVRGAAQSATATVVAGNTNATPRVGANTPGTAEAQINATAVISSGTCSNFSDRPLYTVGTLQTVSALAASGQANASGQFMGAQAARGTLAVQANLNANLPSDLMAPNQPRVLVIRQQNATDGGYLACGELGGVLFEGQVVVGLHGDAATNGASHPYGVAIFRPGSASAANIPEGQVQVQVFLFTPPAAQAGATPGTNVQATAGATTVVGPNVAATQTAGTAAASGTQAEATVQVTVAATPGATTVVDPNEAATQAAGGTATATTVP